MQAAKMTLGQVFANDQQNLIPRYQRPYVWTEAQNWAPLWQDIRQAAEDGERRAETGATSQGTRTYFLGALVLQERMTVPPQIKSWNVVDGQQRLTTLQILLASARAVAHDLGASSTAGGFASLITNRPDVIDPKHPNDRFKVWPLPQDREVFLWAVRDPEDHRASPEAGHVIERARNWFDGEVAEWAADANDPSRRLAYLYQTLKDHMELVQITLESKDDPQVIFEVLNHRGVPLNAADLVKNLLFQALDVDSLASTADELLMNSWLPLDKSPWREERTTGRVKRTMIDLLLAYWLTIRTGNEVVIEHLFADFKKWLLQDGEDAGEVIRSIRHFADRMLAIRTLPDNDPTTLLLDRMDATQTTTPWPVLLYLHASDEIPAAQRERAAVAIDSFLMRRAVCRMTTKDYNRLFLQILEVAKASGPEHAGEAVKDALLGQAADSRKWPTDSEFVTALHQPNLYHLLVRARLKAVLVGIENHLRTGKTEPGPLLKSGDAKLTIEHLLPQSWEKTWPLAISANEEGYEELLRLRREVVHQVGNLTLTTSKLNPSLSNKPWKQKKKDIQKHSLLRLNGESVLTSPDTAKGWDDETWAEDWDEERIALRARWLARHALAVWPKPLVADS